MLEDSGTRVIHGFNTTDPIEIIRHKKQYRKAELLSQMDSRFLRVGFCDGLVPSEGGRLLESKESCNALLHELVDSLVDRLRGRLQALDRTSVIRELLERQEAIIGDRQHWNQTAKAVMALHSQSEEGLIAAMQREEQRVNTGLAARSIMEIAICECPTSGGRPMSSWDADEALALMMAVLDTAACSEAIYHDLAEPRIEVFANGDFDMDHSFREKVMNPFLQAYNRERFVEAAQDYEDLYGDDDQSEPNESEGSVLPHDLAGPFQAEFGLTPEQAGRGMGELVNLAVLEEDLVVETTVARVRQRLIDHCEYSPGNCDSFLRSFGLVHRPNWEQPPQGCKERDIRPWRYGRKLSAVVRPLLIFGEQDDDKIFYSVSMLRAGFTYLVGKIREGQLSKEFFTSREMIGLIGKINDQLGHAFEKEVAERFREAGWRVRRRVLMSELGAPAELGDIDVLAWKEDGQVRVVECKRLQLARSVAEIAGVCRKFSGAARDELHKHLRRLEWIQGNPASLKGIVGFAPGLEKMEDRIVTSNRVPLTYLTSLPHRSLESSSPCRNYSLDRGAVANCRQTHGSGIQQIFGAPSGRSFAVHPCASSVVRNSSSASMSRGWTLYAAGAGFPPALIFPKARRNAWRYRRSATCGVRCWLSTRWSSRLQISITAHRQPGCQSTSQGSPVGVGQQRFFVIHRGYREIISLRVGAGSRAPSWFPGTAGRNTSCHNQLPGGSSSPPARS